MSETDGIDRAIAYESVRKAAFKVQHIFEPTRAIGYLTSRERELLCDAARTLFVVAEMLDPRHVGSSDVNH